MVSTNQADHFFTFDRVFLHFSDKYPGFVTRIDGNSTIYGGLCIDILKILADMLKFR